MLKLELDLNDFGAADKAFGNLAESAKKFTDTTSKALEALETKFGNLSTEVTNLKEHLRLIENGLLGIDSNRNREASTAWIKDLIGIAPVVGDIGNSVLGLLEMADQFESSEKLRKSI